MFSLAALPLSGWHEDLAAAEAARFGPTGTCRTLQSAEHVHYSARLLLIFLATLDNPPADPGELRESHLLRLRLHLQNRGDGVGFTGRFGAVLLLLRRLPPGRLRPEVVDFLARRGHVAGRPQEGRPGYSEREFAAIVTAARSDVAAIRDRIAAGEAELARIEAEGLDVFEGQERTDAERLLRLARTGTARGIPNGRTLPRGMVGNHWRRLLAQRLFLTESDLTPLLILGVALTGRNVETIKDLPAEHRLLEERAVAVNLLKRRRAKSASRETVHWEVGLPSRQLHTPGGYYLLLHRLTTRSRSFSGGDHLWSVFAGLDGRPADHGEYWDAKQEAAGHVAPFALRMNASRRLSLRQWSASHGLRDDVGELLEVTSNRIKTTVEVRTTRALGGHLPTASRTNTMDVSFRHYLKPDPRVRDWAERVMAQALADAENHARAATARVLDEAAETAMAADPHAAAKLLGTTAGKIAEARDGRLDTLVSACLDFENGPFDEGPCRQSFLTCLRCENALVLEKHLPALLALLDRMRAELDAANVADWCRRHAVTWLVVTRRILPRFTAAQIRNAEAAKPALPIAALFDGPKESA
ncbi:hypothetical protein ACFP3U_32320 [Kitasatospora misakiensis]|uniref:Integrase n=1 Tax=Kitasatospora misakiensis TaxID=67330 RepID=A0ABW0XB61_9ACTN